jgi:ribosome-binding protein aMBF1 (putative translation factor)
MYKGDEYTGQDWEPVILKKEPVKTYKPIVNEAAEVKTTIKLQNAIEHARLNAKMSQKDLAAKLNVTANIITDYENGKAVPNNAFIAKIEKILNTKLPRAPKKEKPTDL